MADPSSLQSRIHVAVCSELPDLQAEAEGYYADAPEVFQNMFINHWGRELNRRSFNYCGELLYETVDGSFRPLNPDEWVGGSGATFFILTEDGSFLLQEDGTSKFLRQNAP